MCHTLYCLYVLHREPDPQQIASVWCDLAAALFGAFTDKDIEKKREEPVRGKREGGKMDRKIQLKRKREKNGGAASGHIFTPLTRRDDCCFAPLPLPPPLPPQTFF